MKVSRIRSIVVIGLLLAAMSASMTMPASATYTTKYVMMTGQQISFYIHGTDERVEVYYYPGAVGTRKFEAWHNSLMYWDKFAGVEFYWTNDGGKTRHWWKNDPIGYLWPRATESLYSGSSNIGYIFVFGIQDKMFFNAPGTNGDPAPMLSVTVKLS